MNEMSIVTCNLQKMEDYAKDELDSVSTDMKIINHNVEDHNVEDDSLTEEMCDFTRHKRYLPAITLIVLLSGDADFCIRLKTVKEARLSDLCYLFRGKQANGELLQLSHTTKSFDQLLKHCMKSQ